MLFINHFLVRFLLRLLLRSLLRSPLRRIASYNYPIYMQIDTRPAHASRTIWPAHRVTASGAAAAPVGGALEAFELRMAW